MYARRIKRILDIVLALCALAALAPLMTIAAIAIKLLDPGPVLFRQVRIGRGGAPFVIYKFRSMPVNTRNDASDKIGHVELSKVGSLIRRSNVDELPQLFNILKGEMSLVGPRPALPSQSELLAARSEKVYLCRPGITGLAQVSSFTGMDTALKAKLDDKYASKITFGADALIVLRTLTYLLRNPPVY